MANKVIIIEDDTVLLKSIAQTLELEGFEPIATSSFVQARRSIRSNFNGVILTDIDMPHQTGFDVLAFVRGIDPDLPVIMLTAHADVPTAIKAMREGAYDFVEKPCATELLISTLKRALAHRDLLQRSRQMEKTIDMADAAALHFPGKTAASQDVRTALRAASESNEPICITGDQGVGRRTAAFVVFKLLQKEGGFSSINCADLDMSATLDQIKSGGAAISLLNFDQASAEQQTKLLGALSDQTETRLFVTVRPNAKLPKSLSEATQVYVRRPLLG